MAESTWSQPKDVTDLDIAFGGAVADLMPLMAEIPDEFKRSGNRWVKVQQDWFFYGLSKPRWTPRPQVDGEAAIRHLQAIQRSWAPKHEHKEAAVAYLMSLWFEDVTYELPEVRGA